MWLRSRWRRAGSCSRRGRPSCWAAASMDSSVASKRNLPRCRSHTIGTDGIRASVCVSCQSVYVSCQSVSFCRISLSMYRVSLCLFVVSVCVCLCVVSVCVWPCVRRWMWRLRGGRGAGGEHGGDLAAAGEARCRRRDCRGRPGARAGHDQAPPHRPRPGRRPRAPYVPWGSTAAQREQRETYTVYMCAGQPKTTV
jgi:hypothetical protein